ncbi:S8 family serine peptidase [Cohnella sp. GCM10020058]|uniref:S8 family serine peptidase n=1 Tax=Cohnella sp. GCM10020058 TaxID=3317330 RepID=UPI00363E80D6
MKVSFRPIRSAISIVAAASLLWLALPQPLVGAASQTAGNATKEYMISFKQNVKPQTILNTRKVKHQQKKSLKKQNTIIVDLDQAELAQLRADSNVAFIEPNSQVSIQNIDVSEGETSADAAVTDSLSWGNVAIGANLVEDSEFKGSGIKIAVLDTGVSAHSDLSIAGGINFVEGSVGYADDNGHGTHVAGTIEAKDNKAGIVGIAPQASVYAVKVLKADGTGTYAQVIQGIEWAIENHMDIISMSFTGAENSEALHQAVREASEAGILLVAAAGNRGSGTETEMYPALFGEVVSVGATTQANLRANLSSTGSQLDLVAPGVDIYSTSNDGNYSSRSGTSMAVPHVTAAAASLWSKHRSMSAAAIMDMLYTTATPLGSSHEYGHGLVNLAKAAGVIDSAIPAFQVDSNDSTTPETPGAGEVSIASATRGSSISISTTTPSYPTGVTQFTKLDVGVDDPTSVRRCSNTYTTTYKTGNAAPSPALSCSSTSSWPLGTYSVKYTFYYTGGTKQIIENFTLDPEAPSLSLGTRTRSSISLSWGAIGGVSSYKVFRNNTLIDTVSSTSYTSSGLSAGTAYSFYIKAVSGAVTGSESTSNLVNTSTLDPLVAPNAPTVSSATANSFYVSWNAVSGVSSYKVLINGNLNTTVSTTGTTVSGLNPDTLYSVQVKAVDPYDSNSGATSLATNAWTAKAAGPTGFTASFVTSNSIKATWNAVPGAYLYTIKIIKPTGSQSFDTSNTNYTFAGLTAGTPYTLQVTANNSLTTQISINTDGKGTLPTYFTFPMNGKTYTAYPLS